MKDSSFQIRWGFFLLGLFFALIGFLVALFAREDRRDKFYSVLFGFSINFLISFLLIWTGHYPFPVN